LQLLNPTDPLVRRFDTDWITPVFSPLALFEVPGANGDLSASSYQTQGLSTTKVTWSTKTTVIGTDASRAGMEAGLAKLAKNNGPETLIGVKVSSKQVKQPDGSYKTEYVATRTSRTKSSSSKPVAPVTHNGVAIAQTFRVARGLKASKLGFFLTQIDSSGDVTVLLCRTHNGKPDQNAVLSKVTVAYADLKSAGQETVANIIPAALEAGTLYSMILVTTGNHRVQTGAPGYTEGQFFSGQDNDWISTDASRDVKIKVYADKFERTRTEVSLQTITLSGGITSIATVVDIDEPDGTEAYLEGKIAGVWKSLKEPDALASAPDTIELRLVLLGTSDLQPSVKLGNNLITVRRAGTTLDHLSTARTLLSGKQNFVVDLWLDNYDPEDADQDLVVRLMHGASFATATTGTAGQVDEDSMGTKRARFAFNVGAPITTYKIAIDGERGAAVPPYNIIERVDVAVS
jgi:hypothetical protein